MSVALPTRIDGSSRSMIKVSKNDLDH